MNVCMYHIKYVMYVLVSSYAYFILTCVHIHIEYVCVHMYMYLFEAAQPKARHTRAAASQEETEQGPTTQPQVPSPLRQVPSLQATPATPTSPGTRGSPHTGCNHKEVPATIPAKRAKRRLPFSQVSCSCQEDPCLPPAHAAESGTPRCPRPRCALQVGPLPHKAPCGALL